MSQAKRIIIVISRLKVEFLQKVISRELNSDMRVKNKKMKPNQEEHWEGNADTRNGQEKHMKMA